MTRFGSVTFADLGLVKPQLIAVGPTVSIEDALQTMAKHSLLSLPVFSHNGKVIVYIISTMDVLNFVVAKFGHHLTNPSGAAPDLSANLESAMTLDAEEESYRIFERDYRDTIESTLFAFTKGTHRALITDALNERSPYILTQSDIVRFAASHTDLLDGIIDWNKTIADNGLVPPARPLSIMHDTETAIDGYKRMASKKVPAMPIVNSAGLIVGTLSSSDLRGITRASLNNLALPVLDYLKTITQPSSTPITCSKFDTLKTLLHKLADNKVHRIWVVDDEKGSPIGVVSQSDLIACFAGLRKTK
ncbi:hypothetical protein BJ742DRAFT_734049 [Cladochytrium replicatum]|nr:hypothetical protein BJ742DRAFT_734049 [Cladochytrium replicatum]